ncbi:peptidase M75, Imelysin [Devosia sp. LjRoot16]|uniref:imelysin family protein n=1 Tax=Devosia sp. LjRoot16 TaxID=3342271 RepID=UPI003ECF9135
MRLLLAVVLALSLTPALAQEQKLTAEQVVSLAITEAIRPGFAQYAETAATLERDVAGLCGGPSEASLDVARTQFKAAVIAWSRVELYRLGPLMVENRYDKILFWPDRKGIALRQVQGVLADADPDAADPAKLGSKSVAMQGLGALEFLLFGTGAEQLSSAEGDFRCRYAHAIAMLQAETAAALSAEWNDPAGISKRLLEPSEADPDYRSFREVAEALTGLLAHGTEAIRDQRLLPFLGRDGAAPKPKSALFWRSGMTVPSINANFEGLRALLEKSRIAEATTAENLWVSNSASFEFGNAERAGKVVTEPVEQALDDPKQKKALDYLVIVTQSLDTILGENLAAALGLSVGFSSLDGD